MGLRRRAMCLEGGGAWDRQECSRGRKCQGVHWGGVCFQTVIDVRFLEVLLILAPDRGCWLQLTVVVLAVSVSFLLLTLPVVIWYIVVFALGNFISSGEFPSET